MQKILSALLISNFFSAVYVHAADGSQLVDLVTLAQNIVSRLSPLLVGLALVAFFWFLVNFIWIAKDKPEDQQKNLKGIWMSILALFVMVSIWGIIKLIGGTIGVDQGGRMPVIELPKAK